jgi:hypothetical protein
MNREIPESVQRNLEQTSSPDALIWFLTITHDNLSEPIRVVSDVFDYIVGGETFTGLIFDVKVISDTDQTPYSELRVQNVDRRIGQALREAQGRAKVEAIAYSTADFDLTKDPREEAGTPAEVYAFRHFELSDVEVNAAEVTGRIMLADYTQEPWPSLRATADICPGLFV